VFVDFEASSLSSRSYPIEVGCAWITDDHVVHVADLIRPDPTWPRDWSAESAAVHGIRRKELAHAEPAVSVARRYAALLTGATIVSDAPEFDAHWLGRLLELLPLPPSVRLFDFDHLMHVVMSHEAQRAVYDHLAGASSPHRAGDDAVRLATAWLAGLRTGCG
jgi:DNA polymerase-3 subunit epsilon